MKEKSLFSRLFGGGAEAQNVAYKPQIPPEVLAQVDTESTPKHKVQWEYNHWFNPSLKDLNRLGSEGWEAYAISTEPYYGSLGKGTSTIYYFKRKKGGKQ